MARASSIAPTPWSGASPSRGPPTPRRVAPLSAGAPAGRRVEPEHHPHRGGLPGPVGAEEAGDDPRAHGEREILDRHLLAVALGHMVNFDHAFDGRRRGAV